jgi:hypothetical protein
MEKNRGDEPIQVIIHMYMEISQGNFLYGYLKQTEMSFLKIKMENRRAEQVLWGRGGIRGRGENEGRECRRVNIVQNVNGKMRPVKNILRMGVGDEFSYDTL